MTAISAIAEPDEERDAQRDGRELDDRLVGAAGADGPLAPHRLL